MYSEFKKYPVMFAVINYKHVLNIIITCFNDMGEQIRTISF